MRKLTPDQGVLVCAIIITRQVTTNHAAAQLEVDTM